MRVLGLLAILGGASAVRKVTRPASALPEKAVEDVPIVQVESSQSQAGEEATILQEVESQSEKAEQCRTCTEWVYLCWPQNRWIRTDSWHKCGNVGTCGCKTNCTGETCWSSETTAHGGPCATQQGEKTLPIHFPLLCTHDTVVDRMWATAKGVLSPQLRFSIDDGVRTGSRVWDLFPEQQTWDVPLSRLELKKGLHKFSFYPNDNFIGDMNIELVKVEIRGFGERACSFDRAAGQDAAFRSDTYSGFNALNRLFGTPRDFDSFRKQQLYFVEESTGSTVDGAISSTVVQNGFWKWLFSYSQRMDPEWGTDCPDCLWQEAKLGPPWPELKLDPIPGRSGQTMSAVYEPCNVLSALAFNEAAVWVSCKDNHFTHEEMASIITGFNGLSAGTAFQHACACGTGGRADTFTMDWLLGQFYQIMIKKIAHPSITSAEDIKILRYLNKPEVEMTDVAANITSLMRTDFDHDKWWKGLRDVSMPGYFDYIAAVIAVPIWGITMNLDLAPVNSLLKDLLKELLNAFPISNKDWWLNTYMPTLQRQLRKKGLCGHLSIPVLGKLLDFIITFVEAIIFQEQTLEVPPVVRDIIAALDVLGFTGNGFSDMKIRWNYYNGYDCRARSDHAKWHEKAAHGLVHAFSLAEFFTTGVC